jgi:hypothetical protein
MASAIPSGSLYVTDFAVTPMTALLPPALLTTSAASKARRVPRMSKPGWMTFSCASVNAVSNSLTGARKRSVCSTRV